MAIPTSSSSLLAVLASVLALVYLARPGKTTARGHNEDFWGAISTVGVPHDGFLSSARASIYSITKCAKYASEGYRKFCRNNHPFALPVPGLGRVVIIPSSLLHVYNRSEKEVLSFMAQLEMIQPRWMIGGGPSIFSNAHIQNDVVRKHLKGHMDLFASPLSEELDVAFRQYWGIDSENWTTISTWDACSKVIVRAAGRVFFGPQLCRNEKLLEHSRLYANAVYMRSSFLNVLPAWTRPVIGPLMAREAKRHETSCMNILVPYVEERMSAWAAAGTDNNVPNDILQWMIEECAKAGENELHPAGVAQRLLVLNLMSTFGPANAFASSILDLYGSKSIGDFINGLREECDETSAKYHGISTREAIDKLFRVDSTVRESMRISPFRIVSLTHVVAPGAGLDVGVGPRVPPGTRIGVPSYAVHHDPKHYSNPDEFDAFRYSRRFESGDGKERQPTEQGLASSYSESYFAFGYGKHACPARWFVSLFLKQALAYVIQNYDVECFGKPRPKTTVFNMILPQTSDQVSLRRRNQERE